MIKRKFLVFITFIISINIYVQAAGLRNRRNVEITRTFYDTPNNSHLVSYLRSLKNILSYCDDNQGEVNLELVIGLVLMNVNLKSALQENGLLLQRGLKDIIDDMVQFNEGLISRFYEELNDVDDDGVNESGYLYKSISKLFVEDLTWLKRLPKFNTNSLTVSTCKQSEPFEETWPDWNEYLNEVNNVNTKTPNRSQSDICLASISENFSKRHKRSSHCHGVQRSCYQIIYNGTNFGYPLAHRTGVRLSPIRYTDIDSYIELLMLTSANIGRGCSVFSQDEDEYLVDLMCARAIDETEYIADSGYILGDLILEFIAICSLNGYSQILQVSWLNKLLRLQTPRGCFTPTMTAVSVMAGNDHKIQDGGEGTCNTHTTGVAAAAFGAAIRFIIEMDH